MTGIQNHMFNLLKFADYNNNNGVYFSQLHHIFVLQSEYKMMPALEVVKLLKVYLYMHRSNNFFLVL